MVDRTQVDASKAIQWQTGKTLLRELLERYLGGTDSRLARRLLSDDRQEVTLRIDPDRVFSWDFTERMHDIDEWITSQTAYIRRIRSVGTPWT